MINAYNMMIHWLNENELFLTNILSQFVDIKIKIMPYW